MTTPTPPKKSDLGVRTASAVVMIAVAGGALWLGGYWWMAFVAAVALGVLWEWWGLVTAFAVSSVGRATWLAAGLFFGGVASIALVSLRLEPDGFNNVIALAGAVIATDIGAYFAGRTIGGPKIAPAISPSKTWAGLMGGIVLSTIFLEGLILRDFARQGIVVTGRAILVGLAAGSLIALAAQTGDFFESWMKRRAGVKDSGRLIPGHGGVFDRVDGLVAVSFLLGLFIVGVFVKDLVNPPLSFDDSSIKLHR